MIMGADYYESDKQREDMKKANRVPIGIGAGSTISNTIVDKNARIGSNCQIVNKVPHSSLADMHNAILKQAQIVSLSVA
jgi:ADP-glucose pyrophosphorylase